MLGMPNGEVYLIYKDGTKECDMLVDYPNEKIFKNDTKKYYITRIEKLIKKGITEFEDWDKIQYIENDKVVYSYNMNELYD